ncbi:HigA family addiction module antitoxin [Brevundimonas sp.]|jgi:antitoxin HigA-1|uniref:HigA family addiction module antitoxin n=1 Tax=Brevundimonas sp. TaxID=1871086 RepID=UPI00257CF79E|nr:HigA family addiction module antitoxin [Brevundimonas sp.]
MSPQSGTTEAETMSKSATTTGRLAEVGAAGDWLKNPTPGDILLEEFLKPLGMSQTALAKAVGVPPRRINEIVLGKRAVTADTDLRLARYWGVRPGYFLGLQADYDLMERQRKMGDALAMIRPRAV